MKIGALFPRQTHTHIGGHTGIAASQRHTRTQLHTQSERGTYTAVYTTVHYTQSIQRQAQLALLDEQSDRPAASSLSVPLALRPHPPVLAPSLLAALTARRATRLTESAMLGKICIDRSARHRVQRAVWCCSERCPSPITNNRDESCPRVTQADARDEDTQSSGIALDAKAG